jgi:DNA-binding LacI/PurR family transcriptional regulator
MFNIYGGASMNAVSEKIYLSLLEEISGGARAVGERLPTELALAEQFGTTRMNAHYAVKELETAGLVARQKRRGTFVKKKLSAKALVDLKNQVSGLVRLIVSRRNSQTAFIQWDDTTMAELERLLNRGNYKVTVDPLPPDRASLGTLFDEFAADGARGVAFFPLHEDWEFLKANIDLLKAYPGEIFMMNRGSRPPFEFPCHALSLDPFGEGMLAGEYIAGLKMERVIFVATRSSLSRYWGEQRIAGVRTALPAEMEFQTVVVPDGDLNEFTGELKLTSETAVIAQNDRVAAKITDAVQACGLIPGKDFKLVGFDNDAKYREYNLTTVAPPSDRIAGVLAEMIVSDQWHRTDGIYASIKIASRLIERTSA